MVGKPLKTQIFKPLSNLYKENLEKNGEVLLRDAVKKIDKMINTTKDFDELVNELVKIRSR